MIIHYETALVLWYWAAADVGGRVCTCTVHVHVVYKTNPKGGELNVYEQMLYHWKQEALRFQEIPLVKF